jgi:5-(carboxyamino)imidazole ribonucleotide synthase
MKIGIIGAGQLGRMLALAGYPLGQRFVFLDHSENAPGGQVGDIIIGEFSDPKKIAELASQVDILTFDVENVPEDAIRPVLDTVNFFPPVDALAAAQDRLTEKSLFHALDIPTPDFSTIDSLDDLQRGTGDIGFPCVLKTRRLGYDGKGQRVLNNENDIVPAWDALGSAPLILEAFVQFDCEASIIGVRSAKDGETAFYPLCRNVHDDGILSYSIAPFDRPNLQKIAVGHLIRLMDHFDYVGVLTIEFFVQGDELIANEIAPRVHNSGHWTIEGAVTSQFENHVRAILGLPLGDTSPTGHSAMVNYLGELPELDSVLGVVGAHFHDYGKEPRPKRKLGHCTVTLHDEKSRDRALNILLATSHP